MIKNVVYGRYYSLFVGLSLCIFLMIMSSPVTIAGEKPLFPGYPFVFSGTGRIEKITPTHVIIDDLPHVLSPNATFHAPKGPIKQSELKIGDEVGYIEDSQGKIVSLWLLK